jgi:polysaccharide deacetylase 2 family uncharacterized protein YibQ
VRVIPDEGAYFESVPESEMPEGELREEGFPSPKPSPSRERAYKDGVKPKIAIIIDDLGMDVKHTKQVLNLPAGVTLAFLPYAPAVRSLAQEGKEKGHSLIIHVPMEAMDGNLNIGPGGLKTSMSDAEFTAALEAMMQSFDGYEGINNHMGSRLTQDEAKMDRLMDILAEKELFFVDSKTAGGSVAAREAAENGVRYAERDVFLDHIDSAEFVHGALSKVESTARRKGYAIAIGHPKAHTIAGLRAWLPTLEQKGLELVPVRALLSEPEVRGENSEDRDVPKSEIDMFPEAEPMVFAPAAPVPALQPLPPPIQSPAP